MTGSIFIANELLHKAGGQDSFDTGVRAIIEKTIDWMLDPGETIEGLEGPEKSIFGVKFEKRFTTHFGLPCKRRKAKKNEPKTLDTKIAGYDVDIKCTLGGKSWMIPAEAVDHHCILVKVDYRACLYDLGVFYASLNNLRDGKNQDKKYSTSAAGQQTINWISYAKPFTYNQQSI